MTTSRIVKWLATVVVAGAVLTAGFALTRTGPLSGPGADIPNPSVDDPLATAPGQETVVLSGGCFWGIQAVFQHVKGVLKATSGYAGGSSRTADYETVSSGTTGHAESVRVIFDPAQISFGQLLKVFFSVATDPTELNFQGPDTGTQYRSVVWTTTPRQQEIASAYVAQLDEARVYRHAIVTQITPFRGFYQAENYHQNYAVMHPDDAYIRINDAPKVVNLKSDFPTLYVNRLARY